MGQETEERYRIMISHQKTGRSSKFTLQKDQLEESSLPRVCSLSIIKDNTTVDCGEGDGTPLQDSCLGNPMNGGGWRAAVHGVAESDTTERLHFHFSLSCIGEGNGNPLQCSCLENPRDGGAWWAALSGVAQSRTRLKRLSSSNSTVNVMSRNHPETIPSFHVCRKIVFHKTGPVVPKRLGTAALSGTATN